VNSARCKRQPQAAYTVDAATVFPLSVLQLILVVVAAAVVIVVVVVAHAQRSA